MCCSPPFLLDNKPKQSCKLRFSPDHRSILWQFVWVVRLSTMNLGFYSCRCGWAEMKGSFTSEQACDGVKHFTNWTETTKSNIQVGFEGDNRILRSHLATVTACYCFIHLPGKLGHFHVTFVVSYICLKICDRFMPHLMFHALSISWICSNFRDR